MSKTRTAVETIALVVHPVWTYYRRVLSYPHVPKSLQDNMASGKPQQILDAFPHLTRAEGGFLALVADIISGEDSLEDGGGVLEEEQELAELIRRIDIDTSPRPGVRKGLWGRMLAVFKKSQKRG